MAKKEKNTIPIEAFNYDLSEDYLFSDFLEEVNKDVKDLEKQGYSKIWLMPGLPFFGHPREVMKYQLFALNPNKKIDLPFTRYRLFAEESKNEI